MMSISKRCLRAFTLIELLMVMVVLAVIALIVIPKFADRNRQAKEASLKSDLKILRNAVDHFQADTGYYPLSLEDLTASSVSAAIAPAQSTGNSTGNSNGNSTGNSNGNSNGNSTGNSTGNSNGNSNGNSSGSTTGSTAGATTGSSTGTTVGSTSGGTGSASVPTEGLDRDGNRQPIDATDYHGPYIAGSVPTDPVSGNPFNYSTSAGTVGDVTSSAWGNGLDGTAYSGW